MSSMNTSNNFEFIASNTTISINNTIAATTDILTISPVGKCVIRIAHDGRLFWHEREVETDDDFRGAMLDLAKRLVQPW